MEIDFFCCKILLFRAEYAYVLILVKYARARLQEASRRVARSEQLAARRVLLA